MLYINFLTSKYGLFQIIYILKITTKTMAKARKEGKPKRNRVNLVKRLKMIQKNEEILKKYNNN